MTPNEVKAGDLVYVAHGGERIGNRIAIVEHAWDDGAVLVRLWSPSRNAFASQAPMRASKLVGRVPDNDRRLPAIRKWLEANP